MSSESDAHIIARLTGQILPSFALAATNDQPVDLATLSGRTVVYAYPRTADPALLSDADHRFKESMAMPDFVADDMRLFKRLTMIIDDGRISKVFYPVDAPAEDAENVLRWCRDNTRG